MTIFIRFALSDAPISFNTHGVAGGWHWRQYGTLWVGRIHGHAEAFTEIDADTDLQAHRFVLLGSLNIPAARLPQRLLDILAAESIVPAPGDTLLNCLRALRNKYEGGTTGFDISATS